ncbi:uncharacterized protein [Dendrobates tinctorius]|uniref:uncharacterized protein isoform X1 n=2 Tax=Dendrobates tinctorius TaxID=92724 RepID=UPI003CC9BC3A
MDKDLRNLTRKILGLTLEILCLLTGEDYTLVKKTTGDCVTPSSRESGRRSLITDPPLHSLIHERKNKILGLTNKMIGLLTGEVPVRCQDVTVYFSMEEWEYLEGHKDLYEDVMMEGDRPRTSADGSRRRSPPERGPRSQCTPDRPEEDHNIPDNHQAGDLMNIKVDVVDEEEMEDDQPNERIPPERCPRPLYSPDHPEGNHNVPENYQGEDRTMEVKAEQEETMMRSDPPSIGDVGEEIPIDFASENSSENVILSLNCKVEDEDIVLHSSEANVITVTVQPGLHSTDLSYSPPYLEVSTCDQSKLLTTSTDQEVGKLFQFGEFGKQLTKSSDLRTHRGINIGEKQNSFSECEKCFTNKPGLYQHILSQTGKKPYSCSECGNCFDYNSALIQHERIHTGEKPYSCSECGKSFTNKSNFDAHERIHTSEVPYSYSQSGKSDTVVKQFSCSLCSKCFTTRTSLIRHEKTHTGEKLYSCSECGKCFQDKSNLVVHERIHTGQNLFPCPECGKCFNTKAELVIHERIHTGEKPYSCSECGKCFSVKSVLVKHWLIHTGEKPHSCSVCGKCFSHKSSLITHERIHTGEKPYSCSECGRCFTAKSTYVKHLRGHTGEKPYSCSVCGRCFKIKAGLVTHERVHTGERPFPCSICDKCFKDRTTLVHHERTHSGEKPYSCSICGKCFITKSRCDKHKKCHTEDKLF